MKKASFLLFIPFLVIACSSSTPPEPEAKELLRKNVAISEDATEAELLRNAKRYFAAEMFTISREQFERLKESFPSGSYLEFAEIKIADCDFQMRDYINSASQFEKFADNHPSSLSAPYALLMAGRSYQLSSKGVGRDVAPIEQATLLYSKVLERYAGTTYATKAKSFMIEAASTLAEQERYIADFYNKREKSTASEAREASVDKTYQEISSKAKTKYEAGDFRQFPETPAAQLKTVYQPALKGSAAVEDDLSLDQDPTVPFVQRVECKHLNTPTIFLYLSRPIGDLGNLSKFPSKNGAVSIEIEGLKARGTTLDCFTKNDLTVSKDGNLTIRGAKSASVISLDSPPRLLVEVAALSEEM